MDTNDVVKSDNKSGTFMTLHYHNKGVEMTNLPKILNLKQVRDMIPPFLSHCKPPMVSYSYTRTISGQIFNQKGAVEELEDPHIESKMKKICRQGSVCLQT